LIDGKKNGILTLKLYFYPMFITDICPPQTYLKLVTPFNH